MLNVLGLIGKKGSQLGIPNIDIAGPWSDLV
jgi:hypothetical protein